MSKYNNPRDRPTTKGWSTSTSTTTATSIAARRTTLSSTLGVRNDRFFRLPSLEEKIIRKQQERQDTRKVEKIMHDVEKIKSRFSADRQIEITPSLKSAIRGKTASQISFALLSESRRAIGNAKRHAEKMRFEARSESPVYISRISPWLNKKHYVNQRELDDLDSSLATDLCDARSQMYRINQRAEQLFLSKKRYNTFYH